MAKLSSLFNDAQLINGIPANGAKLFTYVAGSTTKRATYTDSAGLVAQANPIILDSRGEPAQPIWLTEGISYKFVFAPSTDTDPPVSPIRTIDNITGINDASLTFDQWVDSGLTPTYVSATSFTVPGDQTSIFTNKRRIKASVTAGTAYCTVLSATFGALTTVTVVNDSTVLDAGLSSVQLGLITPNNTSLPSLIESYRATIAATATTTPLWASTAQVQDWTGTPTITAFPNAPQAGAWRVVYPAAGTIFTDNANIDVQGDANYTVQAGDSVWIEALTISTFRVWIERKNGRALISEIINDYFSGGIMSTAGSSATMTIGAWFGTDSTNAVMMNLPSINKTTSSWAVGSGNGGLDTGTIANSTWYHFYAIRRPDTGVVDVVFSTNATSPTLPTNYTQYRYIGSGKTNGSAQWTLFTQIGNTVLWDAAVVSFDAVNPGTAAVLRTVETPLGIKTLAKVSCGVGGFSTSNLHAVFSSPDVSDQAPQAGGTAALTGFNSIGAATSSTAWMIAEQDIRTNTSSQIRTRLSASAAADRIGGITRGWTYLR